MRFITLIKSYRPWVSTQELPRTLFAFLWFLLTSVITGATNAYLDRANPFVSSANTQRWRAYDPLLEFLSYYYMEWKLPEDLPDILVKLISTFLFGRMLIAGRQFCLLFRRVAYFTGLGYMIRSIIVSLTMLPNPYLHCVAQEQPNFFQYTLELILQIKASCGDVVFSGHTIIFMTGALVWSFNPHPTLATPIYRTLTVMVVIFSTVGIFSLIASTYHYSLDCLLSVCTMYLIWKVYYVIEPQPVSSSAFARIIHYLDGQPTISLELPVSQFDLRPVDRVLK